MSKRPILAALLMASMAISSASAQILGGGGGPLGGLSGAGGTAGGAVGQAGNAVGGTAGSVGRGLGNGPLGGLGPTVGTLGDSINSVTNQVSSEGTLPGAAEQMWPVDLDRVYEQGLWFEPPAKIAKLRQARLDLLVKSNRQVLDKDNDGQPVRKAELIVTNPNPAALSRAIRAGFRVMGDETAGDLGIRMVTLAVPKGMNVRQGLQALRRAAPSLEADYNHIYEPAGGALLPAAASSLAAAAPARPGTRIAMIDGGVASHPSLGRAVIEQRGFAGAAQPTGHGTAIGSLLVGEQAPFRGAARGAQLYVADVYGGNPAAGSATSIVRALAWAASKKPAVINISLVGPANRTMARAVTALRARGIPLVAAVGNDGPAAPPQYPASYPGVIAVTGVDGADRALAEAGRAKHLDFAAPGADLVAALPGKGYTPVRGTSFAAPFVAARLAATGSSALLAAEAVPGKGKVGRGIVCRTCRVAPRMVGLKLK